MIYRCAAEYRDGQGQYLANHLPTPMGGPASGAHTWILLWYDPTVEEKAPEAPDSHLANWDVLNTRSGWGAGDYMLSLKAGLNNDAHSHLAAGAICFTLGKDWFLTAPGYGLGQHQPGFWERQGRRWNFFSNSTEANSTLLINGVNQRFDKQASAVTDQLVCGLDTVWASVDLTPVYDDIRSVRRSVLHRRGQYFLILDQVSAAKPAKVEWLAQADPQTKLVDGSLLFGGSAGSVKLSMLEPAAPFADRAPTRPIVDVAPATLKTYAAKLEGADLRLAALLQPFFAAAPEAPVVTTTSVTGGVHKISLKGDGWEDAVWQRDSAGAKLGEEPNTADAEVFYARHEKGGKLETILAANATTLDTDVLHFTLKEPATLTAEAGPDGTFLVTLGGPVRGSIRLANGFKMFAEAGTAIDLATGEVTLAAGRYVLAPRAGGVEAVNAWVHKTRSVAH